MKKERKTVFVFSRSMHFTRKDMARENAKNTKMQRASTQLKRANKSNFSTTESESAYCSARKRVAMRDKGSPRMREIAPKHTHAHFRRILGARSCQTRNLATRRARSRRRRQCALKARRRTKGIVDAAVTVSGPLPISMCSMCGWACKATRAGSWEDKGRGVEGAMLWVVGG